MKPVLNPLRGCLIVICFFVLAANITCNSLPKGISSTEATWLYGWYWLPETATKDGLVKLYRGDPEFDPNIWTTQAEKDVKPGMKVPAIIYLHGCAGIKSHDFEMCKFFVNENFAVFLPDSFARPGRQARCNQGKMRDRVATRHQEISYALQEIRKLKWIDQECIILSGFSEGGNSVAAWSKPGFTAHIVMGTNCRHNAGRVSAPRGIPVLALKGAKDPLYPESKCRVNTKEGGKSIVIRDAYHKITRSQEVYDSIKAFLKQSCLKK